jgi:hypothetical protein
VLRRGWRRIAITLGVAAATAALVTVATPSPASADSLRPLNVTLTCTNDGATGLPYGYQVTTGGALYYPPAASDATVVGNAKTFHLYLPTSASTLGVNTWCNGYSQTATWYGYYYTITPGTSTINASGYCDTYHYSVYPGVTYNPTYCTLSSIAYS